MSEIKRVQEEIIRIKRDMRSLKDRMEQPDEDLRQHKTAAQLDSLARAREQLALAKKALEKAGGEYTPDEADIRASALLENLTFMNKLTFEIGGFFGGYTTYTVEAADSRIQGGLFKYIKYIVDGERSWSSRPDPSFILDPGKPVPPIRTLEDLGGYLREIHVEEWMPEYWPDRFGVSVLDGTQWSLKIEFSNGHPAWESFGSNSYPYNFDDFQRLFGLGFDDVE